MGLFFAKMKAQGRSFDSPGPNPRAPTLRCAQSSSARVAHWMITIYTHIHTHIHWIALRVVSCYRYMKEIKFGNGIHGYLEILVIRVLFGLVNS